MLCPPLKVLAAPLKLRQNIVVEAMEELTSLTGDCTQCSKSYWGPVPSDPSGGYAPACAVEFYTAVLFLGLSAPEPWSPSRSPPQPETNVNSRPLQPAEQV